MVEKLLGECDALVTSEHGRGSLSGDREAQILARQSLVMEHAI